ncbi:MAG: hypothetical protein HY211_05465 [Candidatus Omnitrophica bacterium]|nr:hypothetical protein [Candidatus Omnitrophota bacterium]
MPETTPLGEEMGFVVSFFSVPSAALIEITKGSLKLGDTIWIRGHTTDLKETIRSMQIEREVITEGKVGQQVGVKVSARVRRHDKVYKISS